MKSIILSVVFLFLASVAMAGPNLVSDPQEGVEDHLFECGDFSVVTTAQADGSFLWDFASWTGGAGWFDCTVKARNIYEAVDVATGVNTFVINESDPAMVRIKIPKSGSNAGYKVQE
jgi:hypothetical protein